MAEPEAGAIGFSDDGLPIANARVLRRALQYQRLAGGVIALHEEDRDLSGEGVMHEGEVSAVLGRGVPGIGVDDDRPGLLAGAARAARPASLARASVEISRAKAAGVPVTCEASPHHLTLTDEAVRSLDARFKMNPPLRSEDDRQALIDGLRDGTIDCVATDHAPHSEEEKEVPFEEAAMGVTGLETAFAALHTDLVLPGVLALELVVERMTCGGEPFGIEAPRIEPGATANVALIDSAQVERRGGGLREPPRNSCFGGRADRPGADDGRGRAGRVPPAQLRPGGGLLSVKLDAARTTLIVVDVQEGFRKAIPDFERIAKATATLIEGRRSGFRSWSPSSTRRGLGRPPRRWPTGSPREPSRSRRSASRPPRPMTSTSAGGTRPSSAESRPTSASTRRSSTCSNRGRRSRSPRTRSPPGSRRTSGWDSRRWRGRARS